MNNNNKLNCIIVGNNKFNNYNEFCSCLKSIFSNYDINEILYFINFNNMNYMINRYAKDNNLNIKAFRYSLSNPHQSILNILTHDLIDYDKSICNSKIESACIIFKNDNDTYSIERIAKLNNIKVYSYNFTSHEFL